MKPAGKQATHCGVVGATVPPAFGSAHTLGSTGAGFHRLTVTAIVVETKEYDVMVDETINKFLFEKKNRLFLKLSAVDISSFNVEETRSCDSGLIGYCTVGRAVGAILKIKNTARH